MGEARSPRSRFLQRIKRRLSRIRHFRGHGVHSPFIYRLAREVFMARRIVSSGDLSIYESLSNEASLSERYRIEIQNIYSICGYKSFEIVSEKDPEIDSKIDSEEVSETPKTEMVIYRSNHPLKEIQKGIERASKSGTTVVILTRKKDRSRDSLCEEIVSRHSGTTVWRAEYLLIFNNHLPKQHFQL